MNDKQHTLFDSIPQKKFFKNKGLHDFINIEEIKLEDYKNGDETLLIKYSYYESPFGTILIASTLKGICHLAFCDEQEDALSALKVQFPNAHYKKEVIDAHKNALLVFQQEWGAISPVHIHVKGTAFQLKVWDALLKIPFGKLSTYGTIAKILDQPNASRAVGTAIGKNPIAFLIPCHRVVQSSGKIGGFKWGTGRKTALLEWEAMTI